MRHWVQVALTVAGLSSGMGLEASAQAPSQEDKEYIIGIYRLAPGKHLDFLKRQAEREAIAKEAGAPATQWYAHLNGASWDFVSIAEQPDPAQEAAQEARIEELTKQRGLTTGAAAALEFRQFIASHTDTYAAGPFTAEQLVQAASAP